MKKYASLVLLLFVGNMLFAQDKVEKPKIEQRIDNVVKFGAVEPFFSTFSLAYERFIDETDVSLQAKGSIAYRKITLWEAIEPQYLGYSLELQARYYLVIYNRDVPNGLYAGAFGKYSRKSATLEIASGTINFIDGQGKTFGLLAGWQHRFRRSMSRLILDFNFGGGYQFADYSGRFSQKGKIIPFINSGIVPKVDFMIGFAF